MTLCFSFICDSRKWALGGRMINALETFKDMYKAIFIYQCLALTFSPFPFPLFRFSLHLSMTCLYFPLPFLLSPYSVSPTFLPPYLHFLNVSPWFSRPSSLEKEMFPLSNKFPNRRFFFGEPWDVRHHCRKTDLVFV